MVMGKLGRAWVGAWVGGVVMMWWGWENHAFFPIQLARHHIPNPCPLVLHDTAVTFQPFQGPVEG